jgi:hypothetical protein
MARAEPPTGGKRVGTTRFSTTYAARKTLTLPVTSVQFACARHYGNEMALIPAPFARSGVAFQFVPANAHTNNNR